VRLITQPAGDRLLALGPPGFPTPCPAVALAQAEPGLTPALDPRQRANALWTPSPLALA